MITSSFLSWENVFKEQYKQMQLTYTQYRSDYSDEAWQLLCERADSFGWQSPGHGDLDILFDSGFKDTAAKCPSLTTPTTRPTYRVDYIFSRDGNDFSLRTKSAQVSSLNASDHFPVITDLELTPVHASGPRLLSHL